MLLGHEPMEPTSRRCALEAILSKLGLPEDVFGPPDQVAALGPDHIGRYEVTFARLRESLHSHRSEIHGWLNAASPVVDDLASSASLGHALDQAFASVMSLPNLVALFGEAATQNPRRDFHAHFAWRTRVTSAAFPPVSNPFLWQIFAGCFPPGVRYDWLMDSAFGQPIAVEPIWHHGRMAEVLDSLDAGSMDLVHLSNILDWLTTQEATATLDSAFRVLRPGGGVVIRQLNSTLEIPALPSAFVWDRDLGENMAARDRSFFYPQLHTGFRR